MDKREFPRNRVLRPGTIELDESADEASAEEETRQAALAAYASDEHRRVTAVDGGIAICNLMGVLCSGVRIAGWPRSRLLAASLFFDTLVCDTKQCHFKSRDTGTSSSAWKSRTGCSMLTTSLDKMAVDTHRST